MGRWLVQPSSGVGAGLGAREGQFVVPLGLGNSAIRSQERRSSLGLGLTKMYIQANDSLGRYRR